MKGNNKNGCDTSESLDNLDSDSDEDLGDISDDTSADLSKLSCEVADGKDLRAPAEDANSASVSSSSKVKAPHQLVPLCSKNPHLRHLKSQPSTSSSSSSSLDDLSSDSDDEFFDLITLDNRATFEKVEDSPSPPITSSTVPASATNSPNAKTTITTVSASSCKPTHSQSVPAVHTVCCNNNRNISKVIVSPATAKAPTPDRQMVRIDSAEKSGTEAHKDVKNRACSDGNTLISKIEDESEMKTATKCSMPEKMVTPSSRRKYPAPQPPGSLSRQSSSASIARNSVTSGENMQFPGAISRQLSSASLSNKTSGKGADGISVSGSSTLPNRKCQRVPSFKKYPAPPPPGVSRQNSMSSMNGVHVGEKIKPSTEKGDESKGQITKTEELKPLTNGVKHSSEDTKAPTDKKDENSNDCGKSNANTVKPALKKKKIGKKGTKVSVNGVSNSESSEDISSVSSAKGNKKKTPATSIAAKKELFDSPKKDDKSSATTNKRSASREMSVESNSTGDDHSRSLSKDTTSKRTVSGKLASITNKFEAANAVVSKPVPPKSPVDIKTKKFVPKAPKNKLGSLASKFEVADSSSDSSKNVLLGKLQSPYSKPFDPEPVAPSVITRKSIGGININKFGGTSKFPTQNELKKIGKGESFSDESEGKEKSTIDECKKDSAIREKDNEVVKDSISETISSSPCTVSEIKPCESSLTDLNKETELSKDIVNVSAEDNKVTDDTKQILLVNDESLSVGTSVPENNLKTILGDIKAVQLSEEALKTETATSAASISVPCVSESIHLPAKSEDKPKEIAIYNDKNESLATSQECAPQNSPSADPSESVSLPLNEDSGSKEISKLITSVDKSILSISATPPPLPPFDISKIVKSTSKVNVVSAVNEPALSSSTEAMSVKCTTSVSSTTDTLPDISRNSSPVLSSIRAKPSLSLKMPSESSSLSAQNDIVTPPTFSINGRPSFPLLDTAISPQIVSSTLKDFDISDKEPLSISTLGSLNFSRASSVSPIVNGTLTLPTTFRARSLTPLEGGNTEYSLAKYKHRPRPMSFEARMAALKSGESILEDDSEPKTALEKYRRRKQIRADAAKAKLNTLIGEAKEMSLSDSGLSKIPGNDLNQSTVSTSTEGTSEGIKFKLDLSSIRDFLRKTEEEISKLPKYIREPWSMSNILGRGDRGTTEPPRPSSSSLSDASNNSRSVARPLSPSGDQNLSPSSPCSRVGRRGSDGEDDIYVDAHDIVDSSQMDTLMPLPADYDRRCRSVTPNRVVIANTEKLLSQTDRLLKRSRSGNSLKKSYSRSMSAANIEKLSEVVADLAEEHSTAQLAGERLEAEQADRMRLEKELENAQSGVRELSVAAERLESEKSTLRNEMLQQASCFNEGDIGVGDEAAASLYKRKFEWSQREVESLKSQLKQHQLDEQEQSSLLKKQLEKKVSDAREETEEQRQVAAQMKKRSQRLQSEMNDLKILLEEQAARNNLLEKKQRKFDSDLASVQDELRIERLNKEKVSRERDALQAEKYAVDQELSTVKLELELKDERVVALTKQLEELSLSSQGDHEITQLKKTKHELENKNKDQEEELDELAGQVQMLEAAKTRLEMSIEQMRKENKKEILQRDEEVEEVRIAAQKKVKALEAQVEAEHEERTSLMREKHELERRIMEVMDRSSVAPDDDTVHRLKKDLRKTKALLKDTQTMLEKTQSEGPSKLIIRQLKTQLEDCEFAKTAAIKARQSADAELSEIQSALEDTQRARKEAEDRASRYLKEKTELQTQLDEGEELYSETLKKYKSTVSQISVDQITLAEQSNRVQDLEQEKQALSDRLTELTSKVEVLEGETANIHTQRTLQMKVKELESKLELELSTRKRIESQVGRLKEQIERLSGECDIAKHKESQSVEQSKKLNRQLRQAKEESSLLQQRNTELSSKKQELEKQMELMDSEILTLKSDLKLAFKRIEDLQMALQGDISDSDSDLSDRGEDFLSPGGDAMGAIQEGKEESFA